MNTSPLPLKRSVLQTEQILLFVVLLWMTALSLAGLLFPLMVYPRPDLRQAFRPNDAVNLVIGLPALLGAWWLMRRGRWFGLLGLPGALLYVTYNSIAYAAAMPLTGLFFAHLGLAGLSALTIFRLLSGVDAAAVQARLQGRVAERFGAGVLMGFGALFFLRAVAEFFDGAADWAAFGVLVADGLTTPLWILGGLYLWRKQPSGYLCGAGLLLQASLLFIGLLAFFVLQPFEGMIFVPFGVFARGFSIRLGWWMGGGCFSNLRKEQSG